MLLLDIFSEKYAERCWEIVPKDSNEHPEGYKKTLHVGGNSQVARISGHVTHRDFVAFIKALPVKSSFIFFETANRSVDSTHFPYFPIGRSGTPLGRNLEA